MNRRSFLKRAGGAVGVFATASVLSPRLPAGAEPNPSDISATAEDMNRAERYSVIQWNGPSNAQIQVRQLQLFGTWTPWQDAPGWSDVQHDDGDLRHSGLLRTNGAQGLQVRALDSGVTNLTIVRVPGAASAVN